MGLSIDFQNKFMARENPGTKCWIDHDQTIKNQQHGLRERLEAYIQNGCDNGGSPPGAWKWATKPAPKASDWKGPVSKTNSMTDYAILAGLGLATVCLAVFPFDGPAGEAAVGSVFLLKFSTM